MKPGGVLHAADGTTYRISEFTTHGMPTGSLILRPIKKREKNMTLRLQVGDDVEIEGERYSIRGLGFKDYLNGKRMIEAIPHPKRPAGYYRLKAGTPGSSSAVPGRVYWFSTEAIEGTGPSEMSRWERVDVTPA